MSIREIASELYKVTRRVEELKELIANESDPVRRLKWEEELGVSSREKEQLRRMLDKSKE